MECSHLDENVMITAANLHQATTHRCSVCSNQQSSWLCLSCGLVNCGRYINGHAKAHFEAFQPLHCVCINCRDLTVYCYKCDEFAVNDTSSGAVDDVRQYIQRLNDGSFDGPSNNHTKENRQLRRQNSSDSDNSEKKRLKMDDSLEPGVQPKTSGLRNLGNTCFMNAVLQSLSNIQSFCGYIKQLPSFEPNVARKKAHTKREKEGDDTLLVEELRKTLVALWQGGKTAISPESLFSVIWKVVPRFRGYQQQDAHEFMRYLLDRLHTELLTLVPTATNNGQFVGLPRTKSTIVTAIFGGILQNEVNCLICGMESKKHDPFLDLSLDIPSHFTAKTPTPKNGEAICQLSDCLSSFTEIEQLEDTELYMCSTCKTKQKSTKKFWIRRLPNVLCLHLKRFRWSSYFRVKVDTYVEFPLCGLNMSHYVLNNSYETRNSSSGGGCNEYDLAAVIVHHGSGAGSGHYTSYATHDGCWYHFNDSTVTPCDKETVTRCKAYMLFYVRRDIKLPGYLTCKSS